jgi:hypothetical protein
LLTSIPAFTTKYFERNGFPSFINNRTYIILTLPIYEKYRK